MGLPPHRHTTNSNNNISKQPEVSSGGEPILLHNHDRNSVHIDHHIHESQQPQHVPSNQRYRTTRYRNTGRTNRYLPPRRLHHQNARPMHCPTSNNTGCKPRNSFQKALYEKGSEEVEQEGDGNYLFRAAGLQVYGDADSHNMEVRTRCMDFMAKEQAQFVPTHEPFSLYIERMRHDGVHGNNPEIQGISELYNRPIQVFTPSNGATPINIFQSDYKTSDVPIRLAYHDANHYNAIIDPFLPTAGLGLGLPCLEPGLADKLFL
mmetsp:Transcript_11380/g.21289  ORF Transcript_11380/g.21289 Transcript_11380/m.21289 type:complete len:263 (+) Transcript_11380:159-947(+)